VAVGLVAAGASVAQVSEGGSTQSYIGGSVQVGQTGTVGSVTVSAESTVAEQTNTHAITAGIGSGSVNISTATDTPTVSATINPGAVVTVSGNVNVYAGTDHTAIDNLFSLTMGAAAAGYSQAQATSIPPSPRPSVAVSGPVATSRL